MAREPGSRRAEHQREGQHVRMVPPGAGEGDPRGKQVKDRRPGPRHLARDEAGRAIVKESAPRKPRAKKAAPTSPAAPRTATAPTATVRPAARASSGRAERIGQEARYLAQQQAIRATTAKPTITGRAAAGAASGAAVGTAIGGPVGTAVGGGLGAVAGGVSGASAKKAYKAATRPYPGMRRALVAEFAVCAVIVALSPMTDKNKTEPPGAWMRRMTAVMGVFFILGLVSTAGRWGSRAAAGFGGIVTVALVVSERNLFNTITAAFATRNDASSSFGAAPPETGSAVGEAAGEGVQAGAELAGG